MHDARAKKFITATQNLAQLFVTAAFLVAHCPTEAALVVAAMRLANCRWIASTPARQR
jgi:hypothetical protein